MSERPAVRVEPGWRFGQPHMRGISTDAIVGMYMAGESAEAVCEDYGLTRHELLVVLWYEGVHGSKKRRRLLGEWAEKVAYPVLAGWDKTKTVEEIPLPDVDESG